MKSAILKTLTILKAKAKDIPVLIYGNGLFDYALCTEDGEEELWNSNDGYDILIIGENCKLAI